MSERAMTRFCRGCEDHLPYDAFQRDGGKTTGLRSRCRDCCKAGQYRYRRTQKYVEWRKGRVANPEINERVKRVISDRYYRTKGKRPIQPVGRIKRKAQSLVQQAVLRGELVRPDTCELCRKPDDLIEAHHYDYSEPLEVQWLCKSCHAGLHGAIHNYRRLAGEKGLCQKIA